MKVTTEELQSKLKKILIFQTRPDITQALFDELIEKTKKYKEIIMFLEEDDIDIYIKEEEKELDKTSLKQHLEE